MVYSTTETNTAIGVILFLVSLFALFVSIIKASFLIAHRDLPQMEAEGKWNKFLILGSKYGFDWTIAATTFVLGLSGIAYTSLKLGGIYP